MCLACKKDIENLIPIKKGIISGTIEQDQGTVPYIIEKDQHASRNGNGLDLFKPDSLEFIALFDSSAIYSTKKAANQADVNKLYGFSNCGTHHHENSARFGWNWYKGALHIYAYVYRDKKRIIQEITTVGLLEENKYGIYIKDNQYIFTVNGKHTTIIQAACQGKDIGYKLFPYFGGDETAPHTITIQIKDLPGRRN